MKNLRRFSTGVDLRLLGLVGAVVVSFLVGLYLGGLIIAAIHGYIVAARAYCLGL